MVNKVSVTFPESTDAEIREELTAVLTQLAEIYVKAAENAMRREDRFAVYESVKLERAAREAARKASLGLTRF